MAAYRIARLFLSVALLLLSPGAAPAGLQEGYVAYERGDYDTALREFMPLGIAGDPSAQFFVGAMYSEGQAVPQDYDEAARWFRLAAEQAFTEAQYALGVMFAYGRGVPQDDAEAVRWFRPAADYGVPEAQYNLGVAYADGRGVPRNETLAYLWFSIVAGGTADSPEIQNLAVGKRDQIGARLSAAERARGQELARDWRPRVAARAESGSRAYPVPDAVEPPRTQRGVEPNPFRAEIERRTRQNREVQQLLIDLGYDPGPVDGVIGPKTRAAVRDFQADAGLPADGEISDELYAALTEAVSSGQRVAARSSPTERRLDSTGTGFAVSQNGRLLTNHHVVAECAEVRVQPQGRQAATAVIIARDPSNDLALLEASVGLTALAYLDDRGVRPGDSVVAVGFPLHGLLASEANVTTGTVSALAGIGNDTRLLQVTVPVQPGNSGGPLLDLHGRVVGVVVGKLDALQIASVTGDIPQNVNFAIKAGVVRTFLEAGGLPTLDEAYGEERQELRAAALGAKAKEFTVLVECWK